MIQQNRAVVVLIKIIKIFFSNFNLFFLRVISSVDALFYSLNCEASSISSLFYGIVKSFLNFPINKISSIYSKDLSELEKNV